MYIKHLRCFIAVADELHFTKAASKLRIAQPQLTRHIKELENQLGVRLFSRTKRSVELTPAGVLILKEARDLVFRFDSLFATAERAKKTSKVALIQDDSPIAMAVFTPDGQLKAINREYERLWGVCALSVSPYWILSDEAYRKNGLLPLIEKAFSGTTVVLPLHEYGDHWLEASLYAVTTDEGSIREVVMLQWDREPASKHHLPVPIRNGRPSLTSTH